MNDGPGRFLEWNCSYFTAPGEMFRTAIGYENSESMNRCEALVVRVGATVSNLLQIGQELAHQSGRDLGDLDLVYLSLQLLSRKRDEQAKRIAIAALRVGSQVALVDQVLQKKTPYPWS